VEVPFEPAKANDVLREVEEIFLTAQSFVFEEVCSFEYLTTIEPSLEFNKARAFQPETVRGWSREQVIVRLVKPRWVEAEGHYVSARLKDAW